MNGAEPKCALISDLPLIICAMASGCPSDTVRGSNFPPWPGPNACSAAICRVMAWIDTVEIKRHRVERGDRFDAEVLAGFSPNAEQRADPAGGEIEIAGDERLV